MYAILGFHKPLRTYGIHIAVCVEAELVEDIIIKILHLFILTGLYINGIENGMTYRAVFVPAVAESEECIRRRVVSHVVKRIAQRTAIAIAVPRILLLLSERADVCCIACLQVDLREVLNHLTERIVVCEETIVVLTI